MRDKSYLAECVVKTEGKDKGLNLILNSIYKIVPFKKTFRIYTQAGNYIGSIHKRNKDKYFKEI